MVPFGFGWYKFVTPFIPLKQYPFIVDIILLFEGEGVR